MARPEDKGLSSASTGGQERNVAGLSETPAQIKSGDVGPARFIPQDDPWLKENLKPGDPWEPLASPSFVRRHSDGADYDSELERLIRVAARAGLDRGVDNAVNYTTLLVGFAFCDDAASQFLQSNPLFHRAELLSSKNLREDDNSEKRFIYLAIKEPLPPTQDRLYSPSAEQMLDRAADIASNVAKAKPAKIGTRHLLAAFLFQTPDNHAEDLSRWGLDAQGFATAFPRFVERNWPREAAAWRSLFDRLGVRAGGDPTNRRTQTVAENATPEDTVAAAVQRALYVASFGADDPSIQRRDLLDVRDEARAFARIAASRNTRLPLSVGVFGEWGSGKTFFMDRMYEHVEKLSNEAADKDDPSHFLPDIVQIKFNAWHYIETNLWASLVEYIFSELDRKLQRRKPREEVERLFEQLSTSRLLKLEAIDDLIVKRRERKAAEERLDGARRDYEAALLRQSAMTSSDFWQSVFKVFKEKYGESESNRVHELANALGLQELSRSAVSLNEVLKESETEAGRARVLNRAMLARLGRKGWVGTILVVLIGVPVGLMLFKEVLAALTSWPVIENVNNAVLALSGMAATATALIGRAVAGARSALTELEGFRDKLDTAVKERTEKFKTGSADAKKFADAERETARLKNELEQAERKFAEADKRSDEVLRNYQGATARGRLNAFIRDKLASGDYAKHLGLIATIRKDFDQLAQLMADVGDDAKSREDYMRAQQEYRQRLQERLELAANEGTLSPEEIANLGTDDAVPEPGLFTRIVLYIDDLDRCPPDKVVDVLQAIHLLLYFRLFVVVVAVDARWVSRSLREQFPQLLTENIIAPWHKRRPGPRGANGDDRMEESDQDIESGGTKSGSRRQSLPPTAATSHDYLEKIFQIPYWVRPMDADASKKYVKGIAEPDVRRGAAMAAAARGDGAQARLPGAMPDSANAAGSSTPPSGGVGPLTATSAGAPQRNQTTPVPQQHDAAAADDDHSAYVAHSMAFSQEEGDFLEALAPFVGSTPRRGLRFVNLYRLVKTSLSEKLQQELQEQTNHLSYRALITQLAIVTGAPHVSWVYFQLLEGAARASASPQDTPPPKGRRKIQGLSDLYVELEGELAAVDGGQKAALLGALRTLSALNERDHFDTGPQLLLTLHGLAPIARRYSFTGRPH